MKIRKSEKGFTLVELLVVIAIIAILIVLILVALNVARQRARDSQRQTDLRSVQTALEIYASENNGLYPDATLENNLQTTGYLNPLPSDPIGDTEYGYHVAGDNLSYTLCAVEERGSGTYEVGSEQPLNCTPGTGYFN